MHPLTNGTKTIKETTLTVSNGNHVRIEASDNLLGKMNVKYDCSFPQNTSLEDGAESESLNTVWFEIPAGAEVVYEVSNVNITGQYDMIVSAIRKVGAPENIIGSMRLWEKGTGATDNTTIRGTVSSDTSASYLLLYAELYAGSSAEFDVSITVDGVRYV